ncbi:MAG: diaminopimelate epimerase [Clostridia bacterium]|nr:diaminopimelate epimerase [Clostridia bacterium]
MRFLKYHGLGNDYIYLDCFHQQTPEDPGRLSVLLSRRHFSVGSDGLILMEPSGCADARMRVFNADGSEAPMCGNGIRCVAKALWDEGIVRKQRMCIETMSGIREIDLHIEEGRCTGATVDIGVPVIGRKLRIPVNGRQYDLVEVSVGSRHAVAFLNALPDEETFRKDGPALENNPAFPDRANIEFCTADGKDEITMLVWERGSGPTLACGTGASASLAAAVHLGLTEKKARVKLPGGTLEIEWREDGHIYMTGPAVRAFTGEVDIGA